MSRRAAVGLRLAHASRAEEVLRLHRHLIIASDILSEANVEIQRLVEERKMLRGALERMDFSSDAD